MSKLYKSSVRNQTVKKGIQKEEILQTLKDTSGSGLAEWTGCVPQRLWSSRLAAKVQFQALHFVPCALNSSKWLIL